MGAAGAMGDAGVAVVAAGAAAAAACGAGVAGRQHAGSDLPVRVRPCSRNLTANSARHARRRGSSITCRVDEHGTLVLFSRALVRLSSARLSFAASDDSRVTFVRYFRAALAFLEIRLGG